MVWLPGDVIVSRQIWRENPVFAIPLIVVEDTVDHLVTYTAPGAPFGFTDHPFPTPDGLHPRRQQATPSWQGYGMLEITRWDSDYSIMHFWHGPERSFGAWYLNIQEPLRRTTIGYDGQDLELDILVWPDGRWELKDDELLDVWVERGRWTAEEIATVRATGTKIIEEVLQPGQWWWDRAWSEWTPDPVWATPSLPPGWADLVTQT